MNLTSISKVTPKNLSFGDWSFQNSLGLFHSLYWYQYWPKSIYSHGFHSALYNLKCSDVVIKKSRSRAERKGWGIGRRESGSFWSGTALRLLSSFSFFSPMFIIWAILCQISSDIICWEGEKSWESSEGESIFELWSIQQQMPKVYETQD